ncbi:MAG: exodeoxyribonuclease III [Clostridiales bacterium]|nr:exodeoxyribonuclease III [Clostridiales bacterium]
MKIVTYNINGLRASVKLGLLDWIKDFNADVYCFQEVRCNETLASEIIEQQNKQLSLFGQKEGLLKNYVPIYNCGEVPGYAGTLILSKTKPDKVLYDMKDYWQDNEGRTTTIIIGDIAIINSYVPNGNSRLDFKMKYLEALNKYLTDLRLKYSVVCVGDFNIAHNEIDLTNPKECKNKSVFLPVERQAFEELLNIGFVDSFRFLNPERVVYSWRSYRSRQDSNYNSWKYRIDYIIVSEDLKNNLKTSDILDLAYSDHLPVVTEVEFSKFLQ